jgi:glutamate dehydrogenase/leucine dehydrogenase
MAKENFDTVERRSPSGFAYQSYVEVKESSRLTEDHIGKRVMVAGFKVTSKFYLKKVHQKGDKYHRDSDAYTLRTDKGMERCFYADQCRLHPAEYRKGKRWKR